MKAAYHDHRVYCVRTPFAHRGQFSRCFFDHLLFFSLRISRKIFSHANYIETSFSRIFVLISYIVCSDKISSFSFYIFSLLASWSINERKTKVLLLSHLEAVSATPAHMPFIFSDRLRPVYQISLFRQIFICIYARVDFSTSYFFFILTFYEITHQNIILCARLHFSFYMKFFFLFSLSFPIANACTIMHVVINSVTSVFPFFFFNQKICI